MEILVTRYFILRPPDLEGWSEDPEAWSEQWENAVESWEFLIRPCAEKLFMDLATNYKDILAEPLMRVFNSIVSIDGNDVLTKDAIYTAVGLAAPVLHPILDFDAFLHNTLVGEIQVQQQDYNILRRRIAILIGQWATVKLAQESRPTVYRVTQHLLNRADPLNDLVVRLTAARNLKYSVNEWEFQVDPFLPFVDDLFARLMALIDEVEQTETRMGLLNVIGVVVERLDHRVAPYAEGIVGILPPLWEQTGDEHLFKQAILAILTKLVTAMGERSVRYQEMVVGLIRYSVEPGSVSGGCAVVAVQLPETLTIDGTHTGNAGLPPRGCTRALGSHGPSDARTSTTTARRPRPVPPPLRRPRDTHTAQGPRNHRIVCAPRAARNDRPLPYAAIRRFRSAPGHAQARGQQHRHTRCGDCGTRGAGARRGLRARGGGQRAPAQRIPRTRV